MATSNFTTFPRPHIIRGQKLTGQTIGQWLVLGYAGKKGKNHYWHCLCVCGIFRPVQSGPLTARISQSCGCRRQEMITIHGEARQTPEYCSYAGARNRCYNPKGWAYKHYGGRGIKFCFESFQHFLAVLGRRPSPQHSLERIDNNGHYEPTNVKWATKKEQMRNRRCNRFITAFGESKTLSEWAEHSGIAVSTIWLRLKQYHWCSDCAVSLPTNARCLHKTRS